MKKIGEAAKAKGHKPSSYCLNVIHLLGGCRYFKMSKSAIKFVKKNVVANVYQFFHQ